jgi:hypothetical protein
VKELEPELWGAVLTSMKGEKPTAVQVGNWLRGRRDRVYGDLVLSGAPDRNDVVWWHVAHMSVVRGLRGVAGGHDPIADDIVPGDTHEESENPRKPPQPPRTDDGAHRSNTETDRGGSAHLPEANGLPDRGEFEVFEI